jgi:lipopolysaccharide biosynthesis glycosyltransferase
MPVIRDVAFCFDSGFVRPAVVAIHTLCKHWNKSLGLRLTVLSRDSIETFRPPLERLLTSHASVMSELRLCQLTSGCLDSLPFGGHYTIDNYLRLLLPERMEGRCFLYMDADIVVLRDVSDFPDPGHHVMAAAPDHGQSIEESLPHFGGVLDAATKSMRMLNSGVMIVDSDEWQRRSYTRRMLELASEYGHRLRWADQDLINAVGRPDALELPGEWNVQTPHRLVPLPADRVLHYVGGLKPWNSGFVLPHITLWLSEAREAFAAAGLSWHGWSIVRSARAARTGAQGRWHGLTQRMTRRAHVTKGTA